MNNFNDFSWARTAKLGRFYFPRLKKQIIWYPVITIAISLLFILACQQGMGLLMYVILGIGIPAMIYFGPIIFASDSNLPMETMIPAKSSEKWLFVSLYSLIFIPLIVLAPAAICMLPAKSIIEADPIIGTMNIISKSLGNYSSVIQAVSTVATGAMFISVCLYAVMSFTRSRILYSILAVFIAYFGWGAVTVILSFVSSSRYIKSFSENANNTDGMSENIDSLVSTPQGQDLLGHIYTSALILAVIAVVVTVVLIMLTYRRIKERQI